MAGDSKIAADDLKTMEDDSQAMEKDSQSTDDDFESMEDDSKVMEDDSQVMEYGFKKADGTNPLKWEDYAKNEQQGFYNFFCNRKWDAINIKEDEKILLTKIAYGTYGPPQREPDEKNDNDIGYEKEQMEVINQINRVLKEQNQKYNPNCNALHFASIFVSIEKKTAEKETTPVPVFKIQKHHSNFDSDLFIDTSCRIYQTWKDYLEDNKLPKCKMCYPVNGVYTGNDDDVVNVEYGISPASKLGSEILSVLDIVSHASLAVSLGVGLLTLTTLPIAAPVIAVVSGIGAGTSLYSASRSGYSLYDQKVHGKSISPIDSEAKYYWLNVVGSTLGFAKLHMLTRISQLARTGEVVSTAGKIGFMAVTLGCLTVSGIGIVDHLVTLIEKKEKGDLTTLDVFQFSTSLIFFCHDVVSVRTANTIIQEIQTEIINDHRSQLSPEDRKKFYKFKRRTMNKGRKDGGGDAKGYNKVVKRINNVTTKGDLFVNYQVPKDSDIAENDVEFPVLIPTEERCPFCSCVLR